MIELNNRYLIDLVKLDGEHRIKLECPDCHTRGFIDDDQFKGRVSIDCPDCDYHETINLRDIYLETKGYDPEELGKEGIRFFRQLTNRV